MSDTRFRNMLMRGLGLIAVLALFAVPVIGTRAMVQDLFGVLTLLVLALNWNLLAGFAGLVQGRSKIPHAQTRPPAASILRFKQYYHGREKPRMVTPRRQ